MHRQHTRDRCRAHAQHWEGNTEFEAIEYVRLSKPTPQHSPPPKKKTIKQMENEFIVRIHILCVRGHVMSYGTRVEVRITCRS